MQLTLSNDTVVRMLLLFIILFVVKIPRLLWGSSGRLQVQADAVHLVKQFDIFSKRFADSKQTPFISTYSTRAKLKTSMYT